MSVEADSRFAPGTIVIEEVTAVCFDLPASGAGMVSAAARLAATDAGAAGSRPFRSPAGPTRIRVIALQGQYEGRTIEAVFLFGIHGGDLPGCYAAFTSDHWLLSRLREYHGIPAGFAAIDTRDSREAAGGVEVFLDAEIFPQYDALVDSQTIQAASLEECLCFRLTPRTSGMGNGSAFLDPEFEQWFQVRDAEFPDRARFQAATRGCMKMEPRTDARNRPVTVSGVQFSAGRSLDLEQDLGLRIEEGTEYEGWHLHWKRLVISPVNRPGQPQPQDRAFLEPRMDPRTPPPYVFEDVVVTGFKVSADIERVDAIVDVLLNSPSGGGFSSSGQNFRYRAASAELVVEYLEYPMMRSLAPESGTRRDEDYSAQFELCFRLLVGAVEEDSEFASDPMVFCPFLFVDNWASMVSGREVMGYWKRIGGFDPPRGSDQARALRERLWPHVRFDISDQTRAAGQSREDPVDGPVERCVRVPGPGDRKGAVVLQMNHGLERESLRGDYRRPGRTGVGDARRILPWRQADFGGGAFRSQFARDWLRVSGESFDTIQRPLLPRPGAGKDGRFAEPLGGWVRARNTVRNFRVAQPEGRAMLSFGGFTDAELAVRLRANPLLQDAVDGATHRIDVAQLFGLLSNTVEIQPSEWYLASGTFDVKVIDRLG